MPAVSKSQQALFGLVKAVKAGKVTPGKVSKNVRDIAKDMSSKEINKFAKTKTKELPDKTKEVKKESSGKLGDMAKEITGKKSVKDADTSIPKANIHPWVANAMEELNNTLELYLSPKANTKVDWQLLKSHMNDLTKQINKFHK